MDRQHKIDVADALDRVKTLAVLVGAAAEGLGERRFRNAFADLGALLEQRIDEARATLKREG